MSIETIKQKPTAPPILYLSGENMKRFKSKTDNSEYFYDRELGKYCKVTVIDSVDELPVNVWVQIINAKDEAEEIQDWPTE
jgi:hypothetical protein